MPNETNMQLYGWTMVRKTSKGHMGYFADHFRGMLNSGSHMQYEYSLQNDWSTRAWERDDYDEILIASGNFQTWIQRTNVDMCTDTGSSSAQIPYIRTEWNDTPATSNMWNRGGCLF